MDAAVVAVAAAVDVVAGHLSLAATPAHAAVLAVAIEGLARRATQQGIGRAPNGRRRRQCWAAPEEELVGGGGVGRGLRWRAGAESRRREQAPAAGLAMACGRREQAAAAAGRN
jgi:hypothetical protein